MLYAWHANDLTTPLYESDTNSTRDAGGPANKFSIPVVTNGKVYVAANGEVDVYGLFNGEPTAAPPVITPNGGTFSASQSVSSPPRLRPRRFSIRWMVPPHAVVDALRRPDHDQHGYNHQGDCQRTGIYPERREQCHLHVYLPDAGRDFHAGARDLSQCADSNDRGYGYQRKDLLHHRRSTPSASSTLYSGPIAVSVRKPSRRSPLIPASRTAMSPRRPT